MEEAGWDCFTTDYSAKSDTELRQPDLESRAFSFYVFNPYIKWAEYFVTKY